MNIRYIFVGLFAILLVGVGGYYLWNKMGTTNATPLSTAAYTCDTGKTIQASFYDKSVKLSLSDGRQYSLPQVVTNVGQRYTNAEQSIEFTTNDNGTASIGEGSSDIQTYSNCVAAGSDAAQSSTYTSTAASSTPGFSINYPKSYTLNASYAYSAFGPKKLIKGVKFTIPASMATGTNLSGSDTGVSVEWLPTARICTGDIFVQANVKAQSHTENGIEYSLATTTGGAAGNIYEEDVYALVGSKPCTAVRYFIHSGDIGNYPPGAVTAFDEPTLLAQFDQIRQSLTLTTQ